MWSPSRNHGRSKTVLGDHKHLTKLSGTVFALLFIENLGTNFYISLGLIHTYVHKILRKINVANPLIYICVSGFEKYEFFRKFCVRMIVSFWDVGKVQSYEYIPHVETYLGPYQISMVRFFFENNDQKPLTIFLKSSIIGAKGLRLCHNIRFSEILKILKKSVCN